METMPELKNTTTEQRIRAAANYYRQRTDKMEFARGLEHALELLQADGWKHLAPVWFLLPDPRIGGGIKRP